MPKVRAIRAVASLAVVLAVAGCQNLYQDLGEIPLRTDVEAGSGPGDSSTDPPTDTSIPPFDSSSPTDGSQDSNVVDDTTTVDTTLPGADGDGGGGVDAVDAMTTNDSGSDAGGRRPAYGCFEMVNCATLDCPDYTTSCQRGPLSKGPGEAQTRAVRFMSCIKQNGCDYYTNVTCLDANCKMAKQRCHGTVQPQRTDLSCSEVLLCRRNCDSGSCENDCVNRAKVVERSKFQSLIDCIRNNCTKSPPLPQSELQTCMRNNCERQIVSCMDCPS